MKRMSDWLYTTKRSRSPLWMGYVIALALIADGLLNLVLLPFGYETGLSLRASEMRLRRSLASRAKKYS